MYNDDHWLSDTNSRRQATVLRYSRSAVGISYGGSGDQRPHSWDLLQALAGLILSGDAFDLFVEDFDVRLQTLPLLPEMIEQLAHAGCQVLGGVFEYGCMWLRSFTGPFATVMPRFNWNRGFG
jgi:hypothetical protein